MIRSRQSRAPRNPLWGLFVLGLLLFASPAGSRAPLPGEAPDRPTLREEIESEAILDLVRRHRRADSECWQRHLTEVIQTEARAADVDPLLVASIIARESSFNRRAESRVGALGLMQVRPFVGRDVAERRDVPWRGSETLEVPRLNVRLGAIYFRELVTRFNGDPQLALAAYHRGPTRLSRQLRDGSFDDSRYVHRVMDLFERLDDERREQLGRRQG